MHCCLSAEDFVEHGYDEKGCILFTAFLCQRLLEIRCDMPWCHVVCAC